MRPCEIYHSAAATLGCAEYLPLSLAKCIFQNGVCILGWWGGETLRVRGDERSGSLFILCYCFSTIQSKQFFSKLCCHDKSIRTWMLDQMKNLPTLVSCYHSGQADVP